MDPMKSRRWIAAAALAAAVVFLVMVTGEHGPAPDTTPAPVSSSGAVLASDGGPPQDDGGGRGGNGGGNNNSNNDNSKNGGSNNGGSNNGGGGNGGSGNDGGGNDADRGEVIGALQGLLDALGVSADELAEGGNDCGNGGQEESGSANDGRNSNNGSSSNSGSSKNKDNGNGCGQSAPTSAGRSGSAKITIADFAFGQPLTVAPGTTIEVVNTDSAPHNVTAADKSFSTPDLQKDDTATFTAPTTPGRYAFSCTIHPEMTGTLIVEAAGGEQGRTRSSEPSSGSQRGGSGGEQGSSRQHQTTAPNGRENTGGSSDGY